MVKAKDQGKTLEDELFNDNEDESTLSLQPESILSIYGDIEGIDLTELSGDSTSIDPKDELIILRVVLKTLLKSLNAEFNEEEYKRYVVDRLKWKPTRASRLWNSLCKENNDKHISSYINYHFASAKIASRVLATTKEIKALCKQISDNQKVNSKTISEGAFAEVIMDLSKLSSKYLRTAGVRTDTLSTFLKSFGSIVKDFQARNLS